MQLQKVQYDPFSLSIKRQTTYLSHTEEMHETNERLKRLSWLVNASQTGIDLVIIWWVEELLNRDFSATSETLNKLSCICGEFVISD